MKEKSPSKRRYAKTQQAILDAAHEILVKEGIDALSMRALAEKVDYSASALYNYYGSKEELLLALRDRGLAMSDARFEATVDLETLTPPEVLVASARHYLWFAFTYPEYYNLIFNTPSLGPARNVQDINQDPNFAGFPDLIQMGVESGHFKLPEGYTPLLMALQMWITIHGMAMLGLSILADSGSGFDELCNQLIDAFVKLITVE